MGRILVGSYFCLCYSVTVLIFYLLGHIPVSKPFLTIPLEKWYLIQTFTTLPVCLAGLLAYSGLAYILSKALKGKNALIVASTDMTHYEPQKRAETQDKTVLSAAQKLDEKGLYSTVEGLQVSMCGYGPVVAAITATKELGAETGKLLCYKTSGDAVGDYSAVVGYASLIFTR
jgi:AmmeMemoRadiSam system protein B